MSYIDTQRFLDSAVGKLTKHEKETYGYFPKQTETEIWCFYSTCWKKKEICKVCMYSELCRQKKHSV